MLEKEARVPHFGVTLFRVVQERRDMRYTYPE
jgi:hypothetical protein